MPDSGLGSPLFSQIPADCVPLEYAALLRELFTAYRLLEDHGSLKARHSTSEGDSGFRLGRGLGLKLGLALG